MKMKEFGPPGGARVPGAPLGSADGFYPKWRICVQNITDTCLKTPAVGVGGEVTLPPVIHFRQSKSERLPLDASSDLHMIDFTRLPDTPTQPLEAEGHRHKGLMSNGKLDSFCFSKICHRGIEDFSDGGHQVQRERKPVYLAKFHQKLHENEENCTESVADVPHFTMYIRHLLFPPL